MKRKHNENFWTTDAIVYNGSGGGGSGSVDAVNGSVYWYTDSTVNFHNTDNVKSEVEELKKEIARLNKKLNEFIDNPDKIRKQREIDPYGEEDWD